MRQVPKIWLSQIYEYVLLTTCVFDFNPSEVYPYLTASFAYSIFICYTVSYYTYLQDLSFWIESGAIETVVHGQHY